MGSMKVDYYVRYSSDSNFAWPILFLISVTHLPSMIVLKYLKMLTWLNIFSFYWKKLHLVAIFFFEYNHLFCFLYVQGQSFICTLYYYSINSCCRSLTANWKCYSRKTSAKYRLLIVTSPAFIPGLSLIIRIVC